MVRDMNDKIKRKTVSDSLKLDGEVVIIVKDKDGNVKAYRKVKNKVTNAGKSHVAGLINGSTSNPFTYIAVGTGTNPPSVNDIGLQNEVARVQASVSRITTYVSDDTSLWYANITFSVSYSITEAGLFNASNTMLSRVTFNVVPVSTSDVMSVNWIMVVM
jgi:hypothetical protein